MKNYARKIVGLILALVMMIECVGSQESVSLAKSATYNMATDGSGKCIDGEDHPEDVIYNQKNFRGATRKATANMVTSDEGVTMIKQFEGLRLKAYKAVPTEAYYTIGYGHYGADVEEDMVITEEEAVELLKGDLKTAETAVNNMVAIAPEGVTQRQFDALVSFTYNVGTANFVGSSIRAFFVNGLSNYYQDQIIHAIAAYNRSGGVILKGLTTRRLKEVAYFYNDSTLVDYDLTYYTGKYLVSTVGNLSVRDAASSSSNVVKTVSKGTTLNITEVSDGYGKYADGWVYLLYCHLVEKGTDTGTDTEKDTGKDTDKQTSSYRTGYYQVTKASSLNVRKGPSTSYSKVGNLVKGDLIKITAVSGEWGKYENGWICLSYCETYKPSKTTIKSVVNKKSGLKITLESVDSVDGYAIYRKKDSESYEEIATLEGDTVSYWDKEAITNGAKYTYKAYAYNTISGSMCKSPVSNYKTKYRLSTPSLTKVICSGTKKYTATWEKNSKASGYQIEYGTSSALTNATKVKITSTSTTSKKVTVSKSQKNYYVRIRSYVTVGKYTYYSGWSSKVRVYVK